mmetsp:Transcript_6632/g.24821  ORF Transcript_6632/g.24821 Transcript_6632/m.24821 type:complete len:4721 (-) Transcript_6632:61-14223(-)|eukprot:CAMPEP_0117446232 /NCGR_PEP_ID=MMETSP0759-20121206/6222_1 /TAXON_ID=63605 /ORGANISM="Percolomonas cosmopolitus, Strain WS" /LENGTH=4720 /DNA_ID=CAMNT_0005238467 /DNA_START=476 /DNA_END=14638 /DNA_ORIENTATION=-
MKLFSTTTTTNSSSISNHFIFIVLLSFILFIAYSPNLIQSAPVTCSAGKYYSGCDNGCIDCPAGHYCTAGSNQPTPCPVGTGGSDTGLTEVGDCSACSLPNIAYNSGQTSCTPCPAGFSCASVTARPVPCTAGQYSLEGEDTCTDCPSGQYCPFADQSPIDCPRGTFSSGAAAACTGCTSPTQYTTGTQSTACEACPDTSTCLNPSADPQACPVGSYIDAGTPNVCLPCPEGKRCPAVDGSPVDCGAGTYSPGGVISACLACPSGHYSSGSSNVQCTPCASGYDCSDPSTTTPCAAGTYASELGTCTSCPTGMYQDAAGKTGCKICPPGYKCPTASGAPIECADGTYSDPEDRTQCISCQAGTWSDPADGHATCAPCPAGYACSGDGTRTACNSGEFAYMGSTTCTTCPAGSSCPSTTAAPTMCTTGYTTSGQTSCQNCPAGSSCLDPSKAPVACDSHEYSILGMDVCLPCPAGKSCASMSATPANCNSGYYSLAGETTCTQCPAGSQCPVTTDGPIKCRPGYYSSAGQTSCTQCPAGSKCPSTTGAPQSCGAGTFSAPGSLDCHECLPGFYCESTSAFTHKPCIQGTYSEGARSVCVDCPAGKACPSPLGDGITDCQPGYYSTGKQISCLLCPAGYSCANPAVSPVACAVGTFSVAGSSSCNSCPPGYFCPKPELLPLACPSGEYSAGGTVSSCSTCSQGYVCRGASSSAAPSDGLCQKGFYCPAGTLAPIPCPAGKIGTKFGGISELDACGDCPQGFYCEPGAYEITSQVECPPGHYCLPGTTHATQTPCAAGTYYNETGATSAGTCLTCPEGYFCVAGSATYETQPCFPGYYCPQNTQRKNQYACPAGTFNREMKQTSIAACKTCPAGATCTGGTDTSTPTSDTGLLGVSNPTLCGRGTYKSNAGAGGCATCPAGYPCPFPGVDDPFKFRCRPGYYCAAGSVRETNTQCPPGTFTNRMDITAASQCEICPRGYACPIGTGGSQPPQRCAQGHYCPGAPTHGEANQIYYNDGTHPTLRGTTAPDEFACPAGTYSMRRDLTSASECDKCPAGYWCAGGQNRWSGYCAPGHFCPEGSYSPTAHPCPAGTYSSAVNLTSATECTPCPRGHYCGEGSIAPVTCPVGTFANFTNAVHMGPSNDWNSSACMECPAGHYCEAGTIQPGECGISNYSPPGQGCCNSCELGRYCPLNTTSLIQMNETYRCPAGLFCDRGQGPAPTTYANACPKAHFCVEATEAPEPCSPGKYGPNTGLKSDTECTVCQKGQYCSGGKEEPDGFCAKGHYCPAGSVNSTQVQCPDGTYRDIVGAENEQHCTICPNGFYCVVGTVTPITCPRGYYCKIGSFEPESCPIGTFSNTSGLKEPEDCTACPAGYYCDGIGATEPSGLCDPGFYCIGSAFTSAPPDPPTGGLCPRGGFCQFGSSYPSTCEKGTYNNFTGGRSQDDCYACPSGYYCAGSNLPLPSGLCSAGWYCTGGASLPTQFEVPAGYFSDEGASAPQPCQPGTYGIAPKQAVCPDCPEGNYCPTLAGQDYIVCPAGNYCPQKSAEPTPCPAGTYATKTGLKNVTQCLDCDPGSYCNGTALTAVSGPCSYGYYCPTGSSTPTPSEYACTPGYYCPEQSVHPTPCPIGTFSPLSGNTAEANCTSCTNGKYCAIPGLAAVSGNCTGGYYCVQGSDTPMPTNGVQGNVCPVGHHCPDSSTEPTPCANGTYTDITTQAQCFECPKGYYCSNAAGTVNPTPCPPGHYCPESTGFPIPECPAGSYAPITGNENITECLLCTAGKFCSRSGLTAPDGTCEAGYYCLSGAVDSKGSAGILGGKSGLCPQGSYCPSGVVAPIPCPLGTFSSALNASSVDDCDLCSSGKYCPVVGLSEATLDCAPGYYCTAGAKIAKPKDGTTGDLCPKGKYCPEGTSIPRNCPNGTYSNVLGLETCYTCPTGFYCNESTIEPAPCPHTRYCPPGTGPDQPKCPPGTFNNQYKLKEESECALCEGGKYCSDYGLEAPNGNCVEGYYCISGAINENGTLGVLGGDSGLCPAGHYCQTGAAFPIPCPPGTFSPNSGNKYRSSCQQCESGKYCPFPGQSEATLDCAAGFYCTNGSSTRAPLDGLAGNVCPMGHYCPRGSSAPLPCAEGTYTDIVEQSSCKACPRGYYCQNATSDPVDCPAGKYCPEGTGYTIPECPVGTFSNFTMRDADTECTLCSNGFYCATPGLSQPTGPCDAGYYCIRGAVNATAHLGVLGGSGGICPRGTYCPAQSTLPTFCPKGTFRDAVGGTMESSCIACPPGLYCERGGLFEPTGNCSSGFYCTPGQFSPSPPELVCPEGHYCPEGSPEPVGCAGGTYQTGKGEAFCVTCPPGHYCSNNASVPLICPLTAFCPNGTEVPLTCPNGTYGFMTGLQGSEDCASCPPGKYCQNGEICGDCEAGYICFTGSPSPTPQVAANDACDHCICPKGFYCPEGTKWPIPCTNGTFGGQEGGKNSSVCGACQPGDWCLESSIQPIPCPTGQYCPNSNNVKFPLDCPKGTYNPVESGASLTDCLPCDAGFYCPTEGMTTHRGTPCPVGHYCETGSETPTPCAAGTYMDELSAPLSTSCKQCPLAHYCPQQSHSPIECSVGKYCPPGTAGTQPPCSAGQYCPKRATVQQDCPAGYYCPEGTEAPIYCPMGSYCPSNSSAPILCPLGYRKLNRTGLRTSVPDSCLICEAGTHGSDPNRDYCRPCAAGYVCLEGATTSMPTSRTTQKGYICPSGHTCPPGSSIETPCAPGTYNPNTGFGENTCILCEAETFSHLNGAQKCSRCGSSSGSTENRTTCACAGQNRVYQFSDGTCICQSGYAFYSGNLDLSDKDSTQSCVPIVYNRCGRGEVRSFSGVCVSEGTEACVGSCGTAGGTINSDTKGICECNSLRPVMEICDAECRASRFRLRISDGALQLYDPTTNSVALTFSSSQVYGSTSCLSTCTIEVTKMQNQGFLGVYVAAIDYYISLFQNSTVSTGSASARFLPFSPADIPPFMRNEDSEFYMSEALVNPRKRRITDTVEVDGVEQPVVCLSLGSGMLWDVSGSRNDYPYYLKDSPINSNPDFDSGPFRSLAQTMSSNATLNMFVYMFRTAGTYVFANAGDPNKITVIRVMEDGLTCPDDETFKPLTGDNLVGLSVSVNTSQFLTPDFVLIIVLIVGFVLFLGLLLAGVHFFRTRTWTSQFGARPKFKKNTLASLDILAQQQNLEEKIVNLEGFNVRLFLEKLASNREKVNDFMESYKDDLDEKYSNVLRETAQIKEILGKKTDESSSLFNIEENMKLLNEVENPEQAERVLNELIVQIQDLQHERDIKVLPDVTKLETDVAQRVLELDDLDDANRGEVIKSYNLFISKLQDIKESMTSLQNRRSDEQAQQQLQNLINKYNNTLQQAKKLIAHRLQEMNDTIAEKNQMCTTGQNEFTLNSDSAERLREFLQNSLTDIFMSYKQESEDKQAAKHAKKIGNDVKNTSNDDESDTTSELSYDTETESDTEEDDNAPEDEVLESQIRKQRREIKSVQKASIEQLDDDIDQEFVSEKGYIEQHFDVESDSLVKNMKDQLRITLDQGNLSEIEQKEVVRESKRRIDILKTAMTREKSNQTEMLTRLMEQKKARKRQEIETHQRRERKANQEHEETEKRELANLLKSVEEQAAKIEDEKQRELFKQKEILKHKLEHRKQMQAKKHILETMHLKEHLDKLDKIDEDLEKQKHQQLTEMKLQNMQNIHKQQINSMSKDASPEEKDALIRSQQQELDAYKSRLAQQRKDAEQALKERLKERRTITTQQADNRRALSEQTEIKSQERDLKKLRKLMEASLTDVSSVDASRSAARRRQEQEIQKKLHEMSLKRAEKKRLLDEQREKETQRIETERTAQTEQFTHKFDSDLQKKISQKEALLEQQLARHDLSDSEKEKILLAHKLDVDEYKEKMEAARQKQLDAINRKMDERARKMQKALDQRKVDDLKTDLMQQEKLLNHNLKQFKEIPKVHIEPSRMSKEQVENLKKQHDDELRQLKDKLEKEAEESIQDESTRDIKAIETEKQIKNQQLKEQTALRSQMEAELASNKASERERIIQKYDSELQKLARNQENQLKTQETSLKEKLAQRKAMLQKKQKNQLEKKRLEQKEKEEEVLINQCKEAERKKILDVIMDEKRKVYTIEDAVNSVIFERQNKKLVNMEMTQRSEYNQAKTPEEREQLKLKHMEDRVNLKKAHLMEKDRLVEDFAKYKDLMRQGNDQQRKLEDELEKFQDTIRRQKETNIARIERQKQALREQMQKELEEENRKAREDAEKMKKRLEKAKNELQVEELVKEAEEKQREILEKRQDLEADEKSRLLEQHQANLNAFEEALEAERIRQESILRKRIESAEAAEKKKRHEEALDKMNAQFTGKSAKKKDPRVAESTMSLINNISADKFSKGKNFKKLKTAADIFPKEQRWVTPIYQRLKNIESQVLSEKRTFIDSTEPRENEGELTIINENALSLTQLIVCRFGHLILHSLQDKYRSMRRVKLLIAFKLPKTNYMRNAFKNSFYWDEASNTLFIRHTRLATVGKFILTLLHCLAHIHAGNLIDDTHPDFLKFFYAFMAAVSEEVFATRHQKMYVPTNDDSHKIQIVQEVVNMKLSTNDPDAFLAQINKRAPQKSIPAKQLKSGSDFQKQQLVRLKQEKRQASEMIQQHASKIRALHTDIAKLKESGGDVGALEAQLNDEQRKQQTQTLLLRKLSSDIRQIENRE